ncbi:MAG: hypothetical protein QOD56_3031 [Gammaproteobacteria bacterium]|jgi:hypothetical protein|nr:hypothetical protein [Gammaproteobacteria bacterium]
MATPADQRLLELLDKWLKSLELHLKYSGLDDDSYWKIQPWRDHQRPSRWIIDLARQKALALQKQIQERVNAGDAKFCDSLELMTFLANLVGSEHIERFIPLANAETERVLNLAPPDGQPPGPPADAATATREMPKFVLETQRTPAPSNTPVVARTERKAPASPAPKGAAKAPDSGTKASAGTSANAVHEQVIADAARLVQWGRKWYELAELISGMADRPSLIDVRRILQDNKTVIEKRAGRG